MSITKKSTKLNSTMKKCEDFCKNDYLVEMEKFNKKFPAVKGHAKAVLTKLLKLEKKKMLQAKKDGIKNAEEVFKNMMNNTKKKLLELKNDPYSCKKKYCNVNCEKGYDFNGNIKLQKQFRKTFKNGVADGFVNAYSAKAVNILKKKGALSGCSDGKGTIYAPHIYDVFHK
jgi:hypothetical protein